MVERLVGAGELDAKLVLWDAIVDHMQVPFGGRRPVSENSCTCPVCAADGGRAGGPARREVAVTENPGDSSGAATERAVIWRRQAWFPSESLHRGVLIVLIHRRNIGLGDIVTKDVSAILDELVNPSLQAANLGIGLRLGKERCGGPMSDMYVLRRCIDHVRTIEASRHKSGLCSETIRDLLPEKNEIVSWSTVR